MPLVMDLAHLKTIPYRATVSSFIPLLPPPSFFSEDVRVGEVVAVLRAVDPDSGEFGHVTYTLGM